MMKEQQQFVEELTQIQQIVDERRKKNKSTSVKELVRQVCLKYPQVQLDEVPQIQISEVWLYAIKVTQKTIPMTWNQLFIELVTKQHLSLRLFLKLLKPEQKEQFLSQHLSIKGMIIEIVEPLYRSVLEVNHTTMDVSEQIQAIYRNLLKLITDPVLYPWVVNNIIQFWKYDDLVWVDKSQVYIRDQLKEIRQMQMSWMVGVLKDIHIPVEIVFRQTQQSNFDFCMNSQEYIKVAQMSGVTNVIDIPLFWQSLEEAFQVNGDLTTSKICISLLNQLLVHVKDAKFQKHFSLFGDLFQTLDSFGTHITKTVWTRIDPFLEEYSNIDSQIKANIVKSIKPIQILITKAAKHTNEKTIKNCIKTLFKKGVVLPRELVLEIIIPILNKALFYADSPLEGDSKFSQLLTLFLSKLTFLDEVILQFIKYIKYPLAVGAFANAFIELNTTIKKETLLELIKYKKDYQYGLNLRKKIRLIQAILKFSKDLIDQDIGIALLDALPFECIEWQSSSDQEIITHSLNAQFQQIDITHCDLKSKCLYIAVTGQGYESLASVFGNLSSIYSSTYQTVEYKTELLNNLNSVLQMGKHFKDRKYLTYQLDLVAYQLFAYLNIQPDSNLIESIWRLAWRDLQDGALAHSFRRFVETELKKWFEERNANSLQCLINILKVLIEEIYYAKYNNADVLIEELFVQQGLRLLSDLQSLNLDRQLKGMYVHYLSYILTFLREINHQSEEYNKQVQNLVVQMLDVSDQFNAYDSMVLYQLLKRVYVPEIVLHGDKYAEDLKRVALCSFESMMALFGTHTNLNEILSYVDFILDENLFASDELCPIVEHLIRELLKQNQKQWIIHRKVANSLSILLVQFPQRILLFKQVLFKLIRENEMRGYDSAVILNTQETTVPLANKVKDKLGCKGDFFGAYPRFLLFNALNQVAYEQKNHQIILDLLLHFIELTGREKYKNAYMQYTTYFKLKLHLWQCIVSLKRVFISLPEQDKVKFELAIWKAFDQLNHPLYRQYMEMIILYLFELYPAMWSKRVIETLSDKAVKVNVQIPTVFIACVFIAHQPKSDIAQQLFKYVFPMVSSNVAYIRSLCQCSSLKFIQQTHEPQPYFQEFVNYFTSNRECLKIIKNMDALMLRYDELLKSFDLDGLQALQFDTFGEIIHPAIIETLKSSCIKAIGELKQEDGVDEGLPPSWHQFMTRQAQSVEPAPYQFQRKIDFIMDSFDLFKAFKPRAVVGDLIIVASLLEKIPNFGHLCRTSEIFGCKELVIPNKKILSDESFQAVSVSSELHLPISEVKEEYLLQYLLLKKRQGYSLVALEQTSQSKQIAEYKFAEKTVLLLGREKTGVPVEYIELMDACVEIPQYGVIRSLNVHISAVICIWEYVQQLNYKQ